MVQRESSMDNRLDELFLTVANLIYETEMAHGTRFWPFHPVRLHRIIANHFFRELRNLFLCLENRGFSINDIAGLFRNPNKVADYNLMWSSVTELDEADMYYLATKLIEVIDVLRHGDPFCRSGASLVWSEQEARARVEGGLFIGVDGDSPLAGLLSRLEAMITSYAELLYYMFPGFSRMYHGPYEIDADKVFVKEFYDLRPKDLWPATSQFPFEHYRSIGCYNQNAEIEVYFIGLFRMDMSPTQGLKKFCLELDEKRILTRTELEHYCEVAEETINTAVADISRLDDDVLLRKGAEMFFYTLKPLYQAAGVQCEVLPEVYDAIAKRERKSGGFKPLDDLTREEATKRLLRSVDFRIRRQQP